jgi:hypothetical protein
MEIKRVRMTTERVILDQCRAAPLPEHRSPWNSPGGAGGASARGNMDSGLGRRLPVDHGPADLAFGQGDKLDRSSSRRSESQIT